MFRGIDISDNNGPVNWDAVAKSGVSFVWLKATEGATYRNPSYAANVMRARSVGLRVGAYHFAHPGRNSALSEAHNFLNVVSIEPGDLLPVLDIEEDDGKRGLLTPWAQEWLTAIESARSARPLVYTYSAFAPRLDGLQGAYSLWIASYRVASPRTAPWSGYVAWQYDNEGIVPGVNRAVDLSLCEDIDAITHQPEDPFWTWLRWRLGEGEFRGHARQASLRPKTAPRVIPPSWWLRARRFLARRK